MFLLISVKEIVQPFIHHINNIKKYDDLKMYKQFHYLICLNIFISICSLYIALSYFIPQKHITFSYLFIVLTIYFLLMTLDVYVKNQVGINDKGFFYLGRYYFYKDYEGLFESGNILKGVSIKTKKGDLIPIPRKIGILIQDNKK
ncbi:MAG: hypothetical protein WBO70_01385 [Erysipelotrichaceae bacterium]